MNRARSCRLAAVIGGERRRPRVGQVEGCHVLEGFCEKRKLGRHAGADPVPLALLHVDLPLEERRHLARVDITVARVHGDKLPRRNGAGGCFGVEQGRHPQLARERGHVAGGAAGVGDDGLGLGHQAHEPGRGAPRHQDTARGKGLDARRRHPDERPARRPLPGRRPRRLPAEALNPVPAVLSRRNTAAPAGAGTAAG